MPASTLLDNHVVTPFGSDAIASAGQNFSRRLSTDHWLSLSSSTTFGRRRRLFIQLLLVIALGSWINHAWPRAHQVPTSASMNSLEKLEYLIGRPSCPDASRPQPPVDQVITDPSRSCFPVRSADPSFRIDICPVATTCNSFSVLVQRTETSECDRLLALDPPASSSSIKQWLRQEKGPDSFLLRTNGAQRWVSELSVYEGECRSRFDVTLANGGPIWLELFWLYTVSSLIPDPMCPPRFYLLTPRNTTSSTSRANAGQKITFATYWTHLFCLSSVLLVAPCDTPQDSDRRRRRLLGKRRSPETISVRSPDYRSAL